MSSIGPITGSDQDARDLGEILRLYRTGQLRRTLPQDDQRRGDDGGGGKLRVGVLAADIGSGGSGPVWVMRNVPNATVFDVAAIGWPAATSEVSILVTKTIYDSNGVLEQLLSWGPFTWAYTATAQEVQDLITAEPDLASVSVSLGSYENPEAAGTFFNPGRWRIRLPDENHAVVNQTEPSATFAVRTARASWVGVRTQTVRVPYVLPFETPFRAGAEVLLARFEGGSWGIVDLMPRYWVTG
jgi:hypothetical protein